MRQRQHILGDCPQQTDRRNQRVQALPVKRLASVLRCSVLPIRGRARSSRSTR